MKVFLDTNVILDFLAARSPWDIDAAHLFLAAEQNHLQLTTSLLSMSNCLFILRSRYGRMDNAEIILESLDYLEIISTSNESFKSALLSNFADKEDAIQFHTALSDGKINFIITRNTKGFSQSSIPVITPTQFVKKHLKK
ncbi:type II toxin-antitoxin system VapC family toxin [Owenweeksia hongkongensis]|uniref:type II toxin-antitoxin system VapC family toxin n=1 Tax=Owenweeksia hongkongensis TaxID=253245 RepID=UPI003A92B649